MTARLHTSDPKASGGSGGNARQPLTLDVEQVHALSNHLAIILGFVELLLAESRPDDPRRDDLLEIRTAVIAAARLIGHNPR